MSEHRTLRKLEVKICKKKKKKILVFPSCSSEGLKVFWYVGFSMYTVAQLKQSGLLMSTFLLNLDPLLQNETNKQKEKQTRRAIIP